MDLTFANSSELFLAVSDLDSWIETDVVSLRLLIRVGVGFEQINKIAISNSKENCYYYYD